MNEIRKAKLKITISKNEWSSDRVLISPEFVIKNGETVDFDNKAYQNLFKNLEVKEESTKNSQYNDLLIIYPYVREFFNNIHINSYIGACKKGVINNIDIFLYTRFDWSDYKPALFARINRDESRCVICSPFEKQAIERSILDKKEYIPEKDDRVEEKEDKYPLSHIMCYGLLYLMLAGVLAGLIRAIYFWIIN